MWGLDKWEGGGRVFQGGCASYQLLHKLPQNLEAQNIYYLTVSMGQGSRSILAGSPGSGCLIRVQLRCWLGLLSSQALTRKGSTSKFICVDVGRP